MAFRPEEDLSCSICHDVFKDPVVLSCSHSFCNDCVKSWWWDKQTCECPLCKAVSQTRKPPRNLALKNLCETFSLRRSDSETLCSLHFEKFKLFCLNHQEPVCVICRDSKAHSSHRFRPIDEIAQESKLKVKEFLVPIQRKLKLSREAEKHVEQMADYIKIQAEHTEAQMKEKFKKLHRFLQKEEKTRTAALKNEEKVKSKRMRQNMEDLRREIATLSDTIRVTEEEMRGDAVSFLQNYKTVVKRIQTSHLCDPGPYAGDLIHVSKHLGNLTYPIWNQMKDMISFTPIVLDPNTAHPHLILSDDLTSVRYGKRQNVPRNPERVDYYRCVLGSEGFDSGSHIWDVDVGDTSHWGLGVAARSAYWNKNLKSGAWIIKFERGEYSAVSPSDKARLVQFQKRLQKIRIHLKCDRGNLSFFDLETGEHIHSFTRISTETLFPYFSNGKRSWLKISPQTGSTKVPPLILITFIVMMMMIMILVILMMIWKFKSK